MSQECNKIIIVVVVIVVIVVVAVVVAEKCKNVISDFV